MNIKKTFHVLFAAILAVSPFAPPAAANHCTLCEAGKAGDVAELRRLLDKGAEIDASHWGRGALYFAAQNKHTDAILFLLDRGANPNKRQAGTKNPTPFMMAIGAGNGKVLKKMLDKGADVSLEWGNDGGSALYAAVHQAKHPEVVKMLLNAGAEVDELIVRTAAGWHFKSSGRKIIDMLQKAPKGGGLFLQYYISKNDDAGFKKVLNNGVNPNDKDGGGKTALMYAAEKKDDKFVNALLDKNADVDLQDKEGKTALMHAAKAGRTKTAKLLLEADANTEVEDRRGKTVWDIIGNKFLMRALFRQVLLAKHNLDVGEGGEEVN